MESWRRLGNREKRGKRHSNRVYFINSCCRQHPEGRLGNSPSFFHVFSGSVGRRQKARTPLTLMEATSAGRASHWHSHLWVLTQPSIPCALSASGPGETAAKARPEQGPNSPPLAFQVRAVLLGHVETLQEEISMLLLLQF